MMDVHLVDLISLVHEPWPRQLDRKLDCYSTCARIQTPSCTKSRAERGYITLRNKLPRYRQLVERFLILCRIVRTGLRNRGISRYRDPPVVSYRTNQRLVYDRGVRDFCY